MSAISIIKQFEGFSAKPYLCPANVWTIGYGYTLYKNGKLLKGAKNKSVANSLYPNGISTVEASKLLEEDIDNIKTEILKLVKVPLTDNQSDALVSFVYNVGTTNFINSTLLKELNKGNYDKVPSELKKWVNVTVNGVKKPLQGLINRRNMEADLFLA